MANKPVLLSESSSLVLDVVRLSAAMVVFIGHLTVVDFLTHLRDIHVLGEYAVPVFFVLSGFVIRFVTLRRSVTLREYLIDRAARIYSIALPAMALTLVLAAVCVRINHAYYVAHFGAISDHVASRVLLNLTFLSQSWGLNTIPLIDGPFWSLGYECSYYVGFGLLLYLRGWRRIVALMVWALITGPQVLLLAPIWLLGCSVFDAYQALRRSNAAWVLCAGLLLWLTIGGCLAAFGRPTVLLAPFHLVRLCGGLPSPLGLLHLPARRATLLAAGTGVLAAGFLLSLLLLADLLPVSSLDNMWLRGFRRVADGTFALYLMHYPLMAFAAAAGLLRPDHLWRNLATASVLGVLLIGIAGPLDGFKLKIRWVLRTVIFPVTVPGSTVREPGAGAPVVEVPAA